MISSFGTLALGFVSAAILSRYFDKTEYGTYKQILFVYGTLQTIFTIGLPSVFSYFIPRYSHEEGKYFVQKINFIFITLGVIVSAVLYLSSGFISNILNNSELERGLQIFSIFPLFTLPALGVEGLYTALKKTKYIAIYTTISRLLMLLCIVIPVIYYEASYEVAVIGWGVASFFIFIYAMFMKNRPYVNVSKQPIENFYSTVFNYSIPLMLASLVGFVIASSNQFFISRYYGTKVFAEFSNGFISLPIIAMVGGSVKKVLLPVFSKAQHENKLTKALLSYKTAVLKSIVLVFPLILFCFVFARDIIVFVYGDLYDDSTPFFRIALVKDLFLILPYLAVLLAMGHSKIYFRVHLISMIVLISFSYLFSKLGLNPTVIVGWFVLNEILRILYFLNYIYRKENINLLSYSMVKQTILIFFHISICLVILYILSETITFIYLPLYFKIPVNLILFYSIILLTQNLIGLNYLKPIMDAIKKRNNMFSLLCKQ